MSKGFCNWKNATTLFQKHQQSACHHAAVEVVITLPATTKDVGELLVQQHAKEKECNRKMLLKILASIRYLARQGLALRGDGDEDDGNFLQLLKLKGEDDPAMLEWLKRKVNKYTSHEIQNDIIKVMAMHVLKNVATSLQQSPFLTLMMDVTTDISYNEQTTIVILYVSEHLEVHEEFLGLYHVPSIDAATLTAVAKDALVRMNLSMSKLRGQCYDGASTMRGARSGVAKRILDEEPRAVYTHCYGHSINLAASDAVKQTKVMRDALDMTHEITKLIKYSPRWKAIFRDLKQGSEMSAGSHSPGIRVLCPMRWTVRADSLASIVNNYDLLQCTWEEAIEVARDTEMKARIIGVDSQMKTFNFLFGTLLGELLLRHTDNLSQTLQKKAISAAEGQQVGRIVIDTLCSLRTEESYNLFWEKATTVAKSVDVGKPEVPRQRKVPKRYDDGLATATFHDSPKLFYRLLYYEAIDNIVSGLKNRFEQPWYKVYCNLEQLLTKACQGKDFEEEFQFICSFYTDDFQPELLRAQLLTLGVVFERTYKEAHDAHLSTTEITIFDVRVYFQSLSIGQRDLLYQACRVLQLVLVMPATNATSERSFSALRSVKGYLRSTMSQQRLNNLMVLHVHKERTDSLNEVDIANELVVDSEHRLRMFGKFQ